MKKHAIAVVLVVAIGAGITLSKANAFAKTKQQKSIQPIWQDGNPKPVCPPPPLPCS
jgi:hypothetical protein